MVEGERGRMSREKDLRLGQWRCFGRGCGCMGGELSL